MSLLSNSYIAFIFILLSFGFLIFVHELGHFLVAKWVGIRVTQFAIGFGPSILTWRKGIGLRIGSTESEYERRAKEALRSKGVDLEQATPAQLYDAADALGLGETEYRLNYLPLGGYVKMVGQEDLDPTARSDDPRSFNAKPIWARACVISAGVVMNLIVGVIFFIIAFMSGVEFPPAVVGGVQPGSPAATAMAQGHEDDAAYQGLRAGDRITHIDGEPVKDLIDVTLASALGRADVPLTLRVERAGEPTPLHFRMTPRPDPVEKLLKLGILPPWTLEVAAVAPDSPEAKAGVQPGMHVAAVDGQPVASYAEYEQALTARAGEPVKVTFSDPKTGKSVEVEQAALAMLQLPDDPQAPAQLAGLVPPTLIVGFAGPSTPAEQAGLQAGDLVAAIDGEPWPTIRQMQQAVTQAGDRSVSITVWRQGRMVDLGGVRPQDGRLGVALTHWLDEPLVGSTVPGSPAAGLNLPGGSRILSINDTPVQSWADMQRIFSSLAASDADGPIEVRLSYTLNLTNQPQEQATLTLTREDVEQLAQARWASPDTIAFAPLLERVSGSNPWEATLLGVEKTHQLMLQTYVTLLRLFQGTVKVEHLRGPVGIVDESTKVAKQGWEYLLFFMGLISVNLAVLN
ncbi:MAG TPA: site-2 protease family protein, partial [Phycisphaeraceae bacterium]